MPRFFSECYRIPIYHLSTVRNGAYIKPTLLPFINTSITKMTLFAWNRQLLVRFVLIKNRNFTEKAINALDLCIDVCEDIETNLIMDTLAYLA